MSTLVKLIKRIHSKFRNTKEPPRPPLEIEQDWPNSNLPDLDCWPTQEHCIGLCRRISYRQGREKSLHLSGFSPLDWKTISRTILYPNIYPKYDSDADVWESLRKGEAKIGSGKTNVQMGMTGDHIVLRITTALPIDKNFIVHGVWRKKLSSQQSRCWHMSQTLESDCHELMLRMRKPLTYSKIDCPDGYYQTDLRQCPSCPSEYAAYVYRGPDPTLGDVEPYPYYIRFIRWVDLGKCKKEESEEFKALSAGQVCCDPLERAREPPTECLWQGRDWSTIPSIYGRMERGTSMASRAWNGFLDWILGPEEI